MEDHLLTLAEKHPRWGLWKLYRRFGKTYPAGVVNHKRLYRLYKKLGLNLKRKVRKRLPERFKQPLAVPTQPNQVWSMDLMSDALTDGRRFGTFNLIDDFNRQGLCIEVDFCFPSAGLVRILAQVVSRHGKPQMIRSDNGPEFGQRTRVHQRKTGRMGRRGKNRLGLHSAGQAHPECVH